MHSESVYALQVKAHLLTYVQSNNSGASTGKASRSKVKRRLTKQRRLQMGEQKVLFMSCLLQALIVGEQMTPMKFQSEG